MQEIFKVMQRMGADVATSRDWACVSGENARGSIPKIKTNVYPCFPTDLQSAFMSVLVLANGSSVIEETIFKNQFKTVPYLKKMGADIQIVILLIEDMKISAGILNYLEQILRNRY